MNQLVKRCDWCGDDPLYVAYHDTEWGVPVFDDQKLFEFIILEGMQAGLSWITILKKREAMREAFLNFDANKMARFTDKKRESLLLNKNIIRNRLKINALTTNAKAYLEIKNSQSFSAFIWDFVDGEPIVNHWKELKSVPVSTKISDALSKALKDKGFKFVGTTICYAFMQAVGMVNDHLVDCSFRSVKSE